MPNSNHADLRRLVEEAGPFATVVLPMPSGHEDAAERLAIEWKNARRALEAEWPPERVEELDDAVRSLSHGEGEAVLLAQAATGRLHVEILGEPVVRGMATVDPRPRIVTALEARQRALPHLVVMTDRAGADLIAFDGSDAVATDSVEGETLHLHRGSPGGWSQRRFQQRAENRWEENAKGVAEAVTELAERVSPVLIAVAGDVRAVTFLMDSLPTALRDITVEVEAGDAGAVAQEVVRLTADHAARETAETIRSLHEGRAAGTAVTEPSEVLEALDEGRVELLLVHDDGTDGPRTRARRAGAPAGTRVVDAAVAGALTTDAGVRVVPGAVLPDGPVAAILRW